MASNIINKSKDINNTTITDSSEEDISQNSTEKLARNHSGQITKTKVEYNEEIDPEFCIHITEGIEQKRKKKSFQCERKNNISFNICNNS